MERRIRLDTRDRAGPDYPSPKIIGIDRAKQKAPPSIVVKHKINGHNESSCLDLIAFTKKLAQDAENGTLKGLAGIADYDDGYICGLEGSYYENPESAVLPLKRLDRRIMDKIVEDEEEKG